jgi:competence protein ComGC
MEKKTEIIDTIPNIIKNKKKVKLIKNERIIEPILNKGTGAGGSNTNYYGKKFEEKTNNQIRLLNDGYIKNSFTKKPNDYYLSKTFEDKTIIFVLQNGFKMYMKKNII